MNQSIGKSFGSKKPEYNVSSLKTKLALNCGDVVEKEKEKVIQEPKTKKFHSKKSRHREEKKAQDYRWALRSVADGNVTTFCGKVTFSKLR